jgi:hypothetical protein
MTCLAFHDTVPAGERGWYAHYEHLPPPPGAWETCDLRGLIDRHEPAWLDDFDAWHAALCREGAVRSAWWWASPASRPNLWAQARSLKPLFFAAGLSQWMADHPGVPLVHVVSAPPQVAAYVREFSGAAVDPARIPWRALARGLHAFAAQVWRLAPYVLRASRVRPAGALVYSHVFQLGALKTGGDHYFGRMLDLLTTGRGRDVQAVYFVDGWTRPGDVQAALDAGDTDSVLLLDGLTTFDALSVAWRAAGMWRAFASLAAGVPPIRLGPYVSASFAHTYLSDQLWEQPPVIELAIQRAFARALDRSNASVIMYPYEQKGLERMLLSASADRTPPVRTIGYAHPAHTTAHLMLRSRPPAQTGPPEPDLILTAGPLERDFLATWGRKPAAKVIALGSHRHRGPIAARRADRRPLRVLMLTGHGFELSVLAALLGRRPDLFADDVVQVRRTAGGWFTAQEVGMRRLSALSDRIVTAESTLADNLQWCDVALFSSTTAGIEAMLAGRLALYVALHDVFEADPLLGEQGAFARCADENELAAALARARTLTDAEYDAALQRQRLLAERILAPIDTAQLLSQFEMAMDAPRRALDPASAHA